MHENSSVCCFHVSSAGKRTPGLGCMGFGQIGVLKATMLQADGEVVRISSPEGTACNFA